MFTLTAFAAFAAVDGRWKGEIKLPAKKQTTEPRKAAAILDVKTDGGKLTGTMQMGKGKRSRPAEIQDGKIEGDKITFTTVAKTKKGDRTMRWEGKLEGEQLHLQLAGAKRRGPGKVTLARESAQ